MSEKTPPGRELDEGKGSKKLPGGKRTQERNRKR
jgi:hypothetical protein